MEQGTMGTTDTGRWGRGLRAGGCRGPHVPAARSRPEIALQQSELRSHLMGKVAAIWGLSNRCPAEPAAIRRREGGGSGLGGLRALPPPCTSTAAPHPPVTSPVTAPTPEHFNGFAAIPRQCQDLAGWGGVPAGWGGPLSAPAPPSCGCRASCRRGRRCSPWVTPPR